MSWIKLEDIQTQSCHDPKHSHSPLPATCLYLEILHNVPASCLFQTPQMIFTILQSGRNYTESHHMPHNFRESHHSCVTFSSPSLWHRYLHILLQTVSPEKVSRPPYVCGHTCVSFCFIICDLDVVRFKPLQPASHVACESLDLHYVICV